MLKPKIKQFAVNLLMLILLALPSLSLISRPAAAAIPGDGTTGGTGTCDTVKDWFCHGECDFGAHPAVAKDPTKVASCTCSGSPNLTGDALKGCQACEDKTSQSNCLAKNPITKRINQFIFVLSGLVAVIITANVIIGGIQYATSGESANIIQASKKRMYNSAIAFVIFLLTFSLLQWLIPGGI